MGKHRYHRSPREHKRTIKSGRRTTVNRGVKYNDLKRNKESAKRKERFEREFKGKRGKEFGEDLTTMTNKEIEQNITILSKKSLKELRRHQDLTEKQVKIAYDQKNEKAMDNLEIRREMLIASINVKEFKDKPDQWISHIKSIIKRVKSYDRSEKKLTRESSYDDGFSEYARIVSKPPRLPDVTGPGIGGYKYPGRSRAGKHR